MAVFEFGFSRRRINWFCNIEENGGRGVWVFVICVLCMLESEAVAERGAYEVFGEKIVEMKNGTMKQCMCMYDETVKTISETKIQNRIRIDYVYVGGILLWLSQFWGTLSK